jgi:hypothetical protein
MDHQVTNDALRSALQWYSAMAARMGDAVMAQDTQAMLVLMKELAVDYGRMGKDALSKKQPNP